MAGEEGVLQQVGDQPGVVRRGARLLPFFRSVEAVEEVGPGDDGVADEGARASRIIHPLAAGQDPVEDVKRHHLQKYARLETMSVASGSK